MGVPARRGESNPSVGGRSDIAPAPLSREQFDQISDILHRITGIHLQAGKEQLVNARLWKRIYSLGLGGFSEYLALVERDPGGEELSFMIDALTTNKTSFFREAQHFEILAEKLNGWFRGHDSLRIWSAGCSSGEEPYTIAITLLQAFPDAGRRDARILASDISSRVLQEAKNAWYGEDEVADVPASLLSQYFTVEQSGGSTHYRVKESVRSLVRYAKLNLMGPWPMNGSFDFIFCRNVMIYFTRETQDRLVGRFRDLLNPGGLLLIGHSESLTGRDLGLTYVFPAVYQK
jgi:chemotaxis protein methyltransferase CheR